MPASLIIFVSITSNFTSCFLLRTSDNITLSYASFGSRCFSLKRFSVLLFRGNIPFLIFPVSRLIAAFTFPFHIKAASFFKIVPISPFVNYFVKFFCILSPSCNSFIRSPLNQLRILLSKAVKWSFALEFFDGFWSNKFGIIIIALKAILCNAASFIQLFNNFTLSSMYSLPDFQVANRNKFFFQWATFSFISSTLSVKVFPSISPHLKPASVTTIFCSSSKRQLLMSPTAFYFMNFPSIIFDVVVRLFPVLKYFLQSLQSNVKTSKASVAPSCSPSSKIFVDIATVNCSWNLANSFAQQFNILYNKRPSCLFRIFTL